LWRHVWLWKVYGL